MDAAGGMHIPHNLLHGDGFSSKLFNGYIIKYLTFLHSYISKRIASLDREKGETLVRRCTKPNIDGLAKASHFRAADARYICASLRQSPFTLYVRNWLLNLR